MAVVHPAREVRGCSGWKPPGHLDSQALPARCSLGIQGQQKSAGDSVYFQMTFFKKNSLPQMLDPESGMWSCKQLSPPQTLHSSLVVGRGPGGGGPWETLALRGQDVRPGSGLCSWSCCVPSRTLTPPPRQPQQGRLVLASWTGHPCLRVLGHLLPCGSHMAAPCFCSHYAPSLGPPRPVVCPLLSLPSSEPPPPGNPPGISAGRLLGGSRPQGGSTPSCPQAGAGSVGPPRGSLGEHPTAFQRLSPATCLPLLLSVGPPTHSLVAGQQAAWVAGSQGAS